MRRNKKTRHWLGRCPFCGNKAELKGGDLIPEEQFDADGTFVGMGATLDCDTTPAYVECTVCHAAGPEFNQNDDDIKNAIKAWNRRF